MTREVDRSAYLTAPTPACSAMRSSSAGGRSGSRSATVRRAESTASSIRCISRTVPPARVLNGRPSGPSTVPNATCTASTPSAQPAHPPRRLEDQAEVQRLPGVDDVEDPVCLEVADAVAQRREVRGVVAVAAVALLHHQHGGLAVGGLDLLGLDDHRAVAVRRDARGEQLLDDLGQPLVVERLTCRVARLQQHAEPAVDLPEGELGLVDDLAPAPQGRLVACLQGDDPGPGPVGERGIRVELRACHAVEAVQRRDGRRAGLDVAGEKIRVAPPRVGVLVEVLDQHPELRAPVAQVVLPDHGGAEVPEHPRERVADDRRAQVPDVHLLGDVRAPSSR